MDDLDITTRTVMGNTELLLRTGKFSDLTLACQRSKFFVHKAIVCARSPVWAAATEGSFTEAKTKIVEVDVVDAFTLQRALTYLYTGMYDDDRLSLIDYLAAETVGLQHISEGGASVLERRETQGKDFPFQDFATTEIEEVNAGKSSPQPEAQPTPLPAQDVRHCEQLNTLAKISSEHGCECVALENFESQRICNNSKLQANTLVYILADYYQVPELKRLAVKKFAAALESVCQNDFSNVCHMVYESAPPTAFDLRSCLSNAIARNGARLVGDASFTGTALLIPELLRDAFCNVVQQQQLTSNERDAAVAAALKAENEAKEANKRSQEEKQRLVEQVNQARRCWHCLLENNVLFEREAPYPGRSDYSLRCKCRTRY